MDLELANKSVVITGGASNIGRAIALLFAEEGARICVADIDMQSAIEVAELAKSRGAAAAHALKTDVTDLHQVEALFEKVVSKYHQIDVLTDSIPKLRGPLLTTPESSWLSLIPAAVAILTAVLSRRAIESLLAGVFAGLFVNVRARFDSLYGRSEVNKLGRRSV